MNSNIFYGCKEPAAIGGESDDDLLSDEDSGDEYLPSNDNGPNGEDSESSSDSGINSNIFYGSKGPAAIGGECGESDDNLLNDYDSWDEYLPSNDNGPNGEDIESSSDSGRGEWEETVVQRKPPREEEEEHREKEPWEEAVQLQEEEHEHGEEHFTEEEEEENLMGESIFGSDAGKVNYLRKKRTDSLIRSGRTENLPSIEFQLPMASSKKYESINDILKRHRQEMAALVERHRNELAEVAMRETIYERYQKSIEGKKPLNLKYKPTTSTRRTMLCPLFHCVGTFVNPGRHIQQVHYGEIITREEKTFYYSLLKRNERKAALAAASEEGQRPPISRSEAQLRDIGRKILKKERERPPRKENYLNKSRCHRRE